jgi:hypothetical protein
VIADLKILFYKIVLILSIFQRLSCDILIGRAFAGNQVAKAPDGNGGVYAGNPCKNATSILSFSE